MNLAKNGCTFSGMPYNINWKEGRYAPSNTQKGWVHNMYEQLKTGFEKQFGRKADFVFSAPGNKQERKTHKNDCYFLHLICILLISSARPLLFMEIKTALN